MGIFFESTLAKKRLPTGYGYTSHNKFLYHGSPQATVILATGYGWKNMGYGHRLRLRDFFESTLSKNAYSSAQLERNRGSPWRQSQDA